MKMKININHFLIKSKQNKKEIITWGIIIGIIVWIITGLILNPLITNFWSNYGPKPSIVSNVIIFKSANIPYSSISPTNMKNFYFFYYLGKNWSTLFFMNISEKKTIEGYDMSILPTFPICPECTLYSFSLKNTGNKRADKVVIDIKSSNALELILEGPKMINKDCGGIYDSAGCYIVFENINEQEEISFALLSREPSNLFISYCVADGKYRCKFNFLNILTQKIEPKEEGLMMNGKKVIFPTLENSEPNKLYYFDPKQFDEEKTAWTYYQD